MEAFAALTTAVETMTFAQMLPVVCNVLYFMAEDDMAVRTSATYAMARVLRRIARDDASTRLFGWRAG
jgi:hypothetical protein